MFLGLWAALGEVNPPQKVLDARGPFIWTYNALSRIIGRRASPNLPISAHKPESLSGGPGVSPAAESGKVG
jgi:hypothetical protein